MSCNLLLKRVLQTLGGLWLGQQLLFGLVKGAPPLFTRFERAVGMEGRSIRRLCRVGGWGWGRGWG